MKREKTTQEQFWEGDFGTEYTHRHGHFTQQRSPFFAQILRQTSEIKTVIELGANRGHNLRILADLNPQLDITGVELNANAVAELQKVPGCQVIHSSIQELQPVAKFDLVFTCGVLIHINPDDLPLVYSKMYDLSSKYILMVEYYNPTPVEVTYRGHSEKLFKRDFAGEFIEHQGDKVAVLDYGFLWKRIHPAWDNCTWFLLEKMA